MKAANVTPARRYAQTILDAIRDRILDEIGEAAAFTPKRQRAAFAELLENCAAVLAERGTGNPSLAVLAIDERIRTVLGRAAVQVADAHPQVTGYMSEVFTVAAAYARDGSIPMGVKRLPPDTARKPAERRG